MHNFQILLNIININYLIKNRLLNRSIQQNTTFYKYQYDLEILMSQPYTMKRQILLWYPKGAVRLPSRDPAVKADEVCRWHRAPLAFQVFRSSTSPLQMHAAVAVASHGQRSSADRKNSITAFRP